LQFHRRFCAASRSGIMINRKLDHIGDGLALRGNNLLAALRRDDAVLLSPLVQELSLRAQTVLYDPGDSVRFVYFPCGRSLVSFVVPLQDGRAVETALVGREGAVGGIVSQGQLAAFSRAIVLVGGPFLRLETAQLEQAKQSSPTLRHLFARYADCLLAQVFQSVACNAAHTIEQRTAKWLLAALDRTGGADVPLTQEQLASILGVGRSYISRVLQTLKVEGALTTRRGGLKVQDVGVLQRLTCNCDEAVRAHFERVLNGVYPNGEGAGSRPPPPGA
jgi:CRP-like cAMP-binding protein